MPKCANCGIPIRWEPTIVEGKAYCCVGCSHGGPCNCDYERLPKKGEVLHIVHLRAWRRYSYSQ